MLLICAEFFKDDFAVLHVHALAVIEYSVQR